MPTSSISGVRMHFGCWWPWHRAGCAGQERTDELHHAGIDEQEVGVVEDHRCARHLGVTRVHEMIKNLFPDLVCLHSFRFFLFPCVHPGSRATCLEVDFQPIRRAIGRLSNDPSRPQTVPVPKPSVAWPLTSQKAQPHRPPRVVPVEVDQDDALPSTQLHSPQRPAPSPTGRRSPAARDRRHAGRACACRYRSSRAAAVPACRSGRRRSLRGLDDCDPGSRVRDEHVAQAIPNEKQTGARRR